jgi:peptide deformylase
VVIDVSYYEKRSYAPIALINPRVVSYSEEEADFEEGCLSIPAIFENVKRPKEVEVEYLDVNMKPQRIKDDDLLARVMQHEIDHLNATLFIEKISPLRRAMIKNKLKRIKKGDIEPRYEMVL